jgi:undecaprenyl-diphosphatase
MAQQRLLTRLDDLRRDLRLDGGVLIAFLILAALAIFFLKIASEVVEGDMLALDRRLLLAMRDPADLSQPGGPQWLTAAMLDMTALGGVSVLTLLTVVIAGYLLAARKAATAAFVIAAVAGGALVSVILKDVFVRPRPDLVGHLVAVDTTSFPSGHAMNSAVVFLTLGTLLARTRKESEVRIYLIAVSLLLTLAVGISRVYLGVHWPSDVLAGWCVGAAWAVLCSIAARMLQRRRKIEAPEAGAPARKPA